MLVVIDNYDSFTYNLVQYLGEAGTQLAVVMNDEMSIAEIESTFRPTHILISPGPGTPADAGISLDAIGHFAGRVPILGVCLGHQAIGQFYGADVIRADRPVHGKPSQIENDGLGVFAETPRRFAVGRYHSLVIDPATLPGEIAVTATTDDGAVMGIRHRELAIEGVQFHPESILSEHGRKILQNFTAF